VHFNAFWDAELSKNLGLAAEFLWFAPVLVHFPLRRPKGACGSIAREAGEAKSRIFWGVAPFLSQFSSFHGTPVPKEFPSYSNPFLPTVGIAPTGPNRSYRITKKYCYRKTV